MTTSAKALDAVKVAQIYARHAIELAKRSTATLENDREVLGALANSDNEVRNWHDGDAADVVEARAAENRGRNVYEIVASVSADLQRAFDFLKSQRNAMDALSWTRSANVLRPRLIEVVESRNGVLPPEYRDLVDQYGWRCVYRGWERGLTPDAIASGAQGES